MRATTEVSAAGSWNSIGASFIWSVFTNEFRGDNYRGQWNGIKKWMFFVKIDFSSKLWTMSQGIFHGGSSLHQWLHHHCCFWGSWRKFCPFVKCFCTLCQGSKWMVVNPVWFFLLYRFLAALLARSFTPQSTELHNICMFENLGYWGISNFYIPFFKSE